MNTDMLLRIAAVARKFWWRFPHKLLLGCHLLLLLTIVGVYKYLPYSPILVVSAENSTDWPYEPASCYKHLRENPDRGVPCIPANSKPNVVLLGDSHAQQLVFGFETASARREEENQFNTVLLSSELMLGDWRFLDQSRQMQLLFIREVLAGLSTDDFIIFSISSKHLNQSVLSRLTNSYDLEAEFARLLINIFNLEAIAARIILMLDNPHLETNVAHICSRYRESQNELCRVSLEEYRAQNAPLRSAYEMASSAIPTILGNDVIYDVTGFFCSVDNCDLYDGNGFLLIDDNHISAAVSNRLIETFLSEVQ